MSILCAKIIDIWRNWLELLETVPRGPVFRHNMLKFFLLHALKSE